MVSRSTQQVWSLISEAPWSFPGKQLSESNEHQMPEPFREVLLKRVTCPPLTMAENPRHPTPCLANMELNKGALNRWLPCSKNPLCWFHVCFIDRFPLRTSCVGSMFALWIICLEKTLRRFHASLAERGSENPSKGSLAARASPSQFSITIAVILTSLLLSNLLRTGDRLGTRQDRLRHACLHRHTCRPRAAQLRLV